MRISARRLAALAVCATLAASVSACDSGEGASGDNPLENAFAGIDSSMADQTVTFQDVSVTRHLVTVGNKDNLVYAPLRGLGLPELSSLTGPSLKPGWGFEEKDVKTAVNLGSNSASRQTGSFDRDAIGKAMKKRGYAVSEKDGTSHITKSGEATVDVSDTARTLAVHGGHTLTVAEPDKSLLDDKDEQAVLDCLGDVYEATVYGKHQGKNKDVTLLGIGGRLDKQKHSTEKLCALTVSKKAADATAKSLRAAAQGPYQGSKISVGEGDTPVVTMTWKNSRDIPAGAYNQDYRLPNAVLKII